MKFTTLSAVAVLSSASWISPAFSGPTTSQDWRKSVGAVYTITNLESGNHVVTANMMDDGMLTFGDVFDAGGIGAHGVDPSVPAGDPLFSQGSVQVSHKRHLLATINAGSNTVVAFRIDPENPAHLTMLGKPVPSGGEFPVSVVFNRAGTRVCVLNGGAVNGVRCFSIDGGEGLKIIKHSTRYLEINETTPASGALGSVSQISFANDDKNLFVSVKGTGEPSNPGFLAIWNVAPNGSLSKDFRYVPGGVAPFGFSAIQGSNAFLISDPGLGYDIWSFEGKDLSKAKVDVSLVSIPAQVAVCWSAYSPKTGNYFLIDAVDTITEISIDHKLNSKIVKQYKTAKGSFLLDASVAVVNGNNFMYNLAAAPSNILVNSILGSGDMQQIQAFDFGTPARKMGVDVQLKGSLGMASYVRKQA
ncbi:hypothetical protein AX17_002305 [Amanita inopinata Kibby_2008]|nr:hypothetical protein AX17_002305 [Amanita inopinata Kibby_2008]